MKNTPSYTNKIISNKNELPAIFESDVLMYIETKKPFIKKIVKNIYKKNRNSFEQCGINEEDIESIFTYHAYSLSNKILESQDKILFNSLKQRGIKIVKAYSTRQLQASKFYKAFVINDVATPEQIVLAKEEAYLLFKQMNEILLKNSNTYAKNIYNQNLKKFLENNITIGIIENLIYLAAFKHIEKKYQKSQKINYKEFKKQLSTSISKFVKSLN